METIRSWSATSSAAPAVAWSLFAEPARWHRWAPHVRGAVGLGDPEIRAGARGVVRLVGVVPVPARILAVSPGRSWDWRVGPVTMRHAVEPRRAGCEVQLELRAPGPLEAALAATYGPIIAALMRNLARVAASESPAD